MTTEQTEDRSIGQIIDLDDEPNAHKAITIEEISTALEQRRGDLLDRIAVETKLRALASERIKEYRVTLEGVNRLLNARAPRTRKAKA